MLKKSVIFSIAITCFLVIALILIHNFQISKQLEYTGILTIASFIGILAYEMLKARKFHLAIVGNNVGNKNHAHISVPGPSRVYHDPNSALEALRRSEEKYRFIFENNAFPKFIFELEGFRIVEVNNAALEKYGYSREEFLELTLDQLRSENEKNRVKDFAEYISKNNLSNFRASSWHVKKDGSRMFMDVSICFTMDSGKKVGIVQVNDITQKKKAEDALVQSEANLMSLIENTGDAIWSINKKGKVIVINHAYDDLYKQYYNISLKPGMDIFEGMREESRNAHYPVFLKALSGEQMNFEWVDVREGKENQYYEVKINPIITGNGEITGVSYFMRNITRRKLAQAELLRKEEKYRVMFENNPIPMFMIEPETLDIIDVNNATIRNYGYSREEFKKLNVVDIRGGEVMAGPKSDLKNLVTDEKKIHSSVTIHRKKDGSFITVEITVFLISVKGETVRLAICNDITEKKKTSEALMQSEANLKALIENTSDSIWAVDTNGTVQSINKANQKLFYAMHGIWLEKGMNIFEGINDELKKESIASFIKIISGETLKYEKEVIVNGAPSYFEVSASPIITASGEITGASYFSHDITERKLTEIQLKKNEEKYRVLIETMHEGLLYVDNDDNVQFANDRFLEMSGYTAEEIQGKRPLMFILDEKNREKVLEKSKLRLKGIADDYEIQFIRKNGEKLWVLVSGSPLFNANNEIIGTIATFIDINERKMAETKMLAKNKELDEFAYIVSHDLKAPLRAINNLSEWIADDMGSDLPTEVKQNVALLRSRVRRMEMLINGILEYSRIGRNKTVAEIIDINLFLKDIVEILSPPKSFTIQIIAAIQPFYAEKIKLHQVFSNLIGNAVKHHESENGNIIIYANENGDFCEFTVEDDGPGIDSQFHEKIFAIFQTLKPKDIVESTGIGLTIVKKIVEENGGTIRLESQPGKGAKFIFTWQKRKSEEENDSEINNAG